MTVLIVVGVVALLGGALLALDWFMAGRKGRRTFGSARDAEAGNLNAGYAAVERDATQLQQKSPWG